MYLNLNNFKIFLVAIVALCATLCNANRQPTYQVSLYVHLHPRGPPIHLCNGIIVQSRLILTTASCVHFKFSPSSPIISIVPGMMSIIAGSLTPISEELTIPVADILVADNFNYATGENDLALLRLSGNLPLNTRKDMSWIILEDAENYDGPCLANFYIRNSLDGAQNYIQSEELPLLDSEACSTRSNLSNVRENDICSIYHLSTGFNCDAFETLQHYNGDRGTGLVCENKLVGILSTILPLQNKTDCMQEPIKAYYSTLEPHLNWIYEVITAEELKMLDQGDYMSSQPYAGETNAFVQPELIEAASTAAYSAENSTTTSERSVQHNAAAQIVDNFQMLSLIFGICFIFNY